MDIRNGVFAKTLSSLLLKFCLEKYKKRNAMMNRCLLLMSMCVMTSQLMSMQKACIKPGDELKTLALAIKPEDYATVLKKYYTVKPSAVSQSISALLDRSFLPDGMSKHVETTCEYNDDMYTQQIVQIMQEYSIRHDGHICFSDKIKTAIYAIQNQKITEKNDEIRHLDGRDRCSLGFIVIGGVWAFMFGMMDIIFPAIFLAGNNRC
jgi:hypothetical protein